MEKVTQGEIKSLTNQFTAHSSIIYIQRETKLHS